MRLGGSRRQDVVAPYGPSSLVTSGFSPVAAMRTVEPTRCEAVPMDARSNDYDSFAEAYAAENENSLVNAYYERPAMLALAGEVTGRHILDAGCGAGPPPDSCTT